jgi:hypothetical protein
MLLLQGIVEIDALRACASATGFNGHRASSDVEEVDVDKLKAMVHVKDEDIFGLDKYVAPHEGHHK